MPEERETPCLSSLELQVACQLLHAVVAHEGAENRKRVCMDAMGLILQMMEARLAAPRVDDLPRPNITMGGVLLLKEGDSFREQAKKVEAVGRDEAWSSANLYDRLEHLQTFTSTVGRCCSILRH